MTLKNQNLKNNLILIIILKKIIVILQSDFYKV